MVPMSPFESLDPRFNRLINGSVRLETLYAGCRWAEGPAYFLSKPQPDLV
jgi:sugar lactone lactonase YvrE